MKTVVYQSYRTVNVPDWISLCMLSVREWARQQEFEYRFFDDVMFSYAPDWYREKVANNVLLVSDLARLEIARELTSEGFDRAIWIDADILIFDPTEFSVNVYEQFAFCREIWLDLADGNRLAWSSRVNNSVSVFLGDNDFLDFYRYACQQLVRNNEKPSPLAVGTSFLTSLQPVLGFQLITSVGILSPILMYEILNGKTQALQVYMNQVGQPLRAINLCASLGGKRLLDLVVDDAAFARTVDRLLEGQGAILNSLLAGKAW
jgi:hypothetical protein